MFALSEDDLNGSILDCAAGPSSFNAEMHARGKHVVSIDPIYRFSPDEIRSRVQAVCQTMIEQVRQQPNQFVWDCIRSPQHLGEIRLAAMERFIKDFEAAKADRYFDLSLPDLPAMQFDLALSSHFLFLYSDKLDVQFHLSAIIAMLSVAPEIRIFPVTDLAGETSPHLNAVRKAFDTELVRVPYEFLRGANQMLRINRCASDRVLP